MRSVRALLSVVAALALCLVAPPREAAAATYAASYAARVPAMLAAGVLAPIPVFVTNTGTATWNATGAQPVNVAYHWRRADGSLLMWDGGRAPLGADVPAAATRLVDAQVRVPDAAGTYRLEIALVKEGVTWFDPAPAQTTTVVGGAPLRADIGPVTLPAVLAGRTVTVDIPVRNAGTAAWNASGAQPVDLSYHWFDTSGRVVEWDGARTALGGDLRAGDSRTVRASIGAPETPGAYFLVVEMVKEGVTWFGPQLARGAEIADPARSARYEAPASALGRLASTQTLDLTVTNTGSERWAAGGPTPVHLSYHWRDAQGGVVVWDGERSAFASDVPPGETRTATMRVTTPSRTGTFTLWIDLVQEGVAWFSGAGTPPAHVTWRITSGLDASYGATTMAASAVPGGAVDVQVTLTNDGSSVWPAGGSNPVHLSYHVFDGAGRAVVWDGARGVLAQDVGLGGTIVVPIVVRVPSANGPYTIAWDLVQEGVAWFSDLGVATKREPFVVAADVTLYGKGFGHGVGMSQWGAHGWAQGAVSGARRTAEQIIDLYYPLTRLDTVPARLTTLRVHLSSPDDGCIARTVTSFSQQRSAGGLRVRNYETGTTIAAASGSPTWAPQQTIRIWVANDGLLHVMDEWSGTQVAAFSGQIRIAPLDPAQPITIDQKGPRAYRGELHYAAESPNALGVVNVLGLEDYTRGAVPAEMPTQFGWELEAFKAQAYATRTYAAYAAQLANAPYDLHDGTQDQCYGGVSKETPLTDQAVVATGGRVITSGGDPIKAYYSSSDGGTTEVDNCVFMIDKPPLLVSGLYTHACRASGFPYVAVTLDPADAAASDSRGPNPHRSWTASLTGPQLVEAIKRIETPTDVGAFVAIDLSNRDRSGRVISVRVQGTRVTVEVEGRLLLRTLLGLKSTLVRAQPF